MNSRSVFDGAPVTKNLIAFFKKPKGILLLDSKGVIKELYGREHAMMMQEIGYWYIDNWQDFLLNYSYNKYIVVMIESETSIVYLPKNVSEIQKRELIDYIEKNVSSEKRNLLSFYVMQCVDESNDEFNGVIRDNRGVIKHIEGETINEEKSIKYIDFLKLLEDLTLNNDNYRLKR